MIEKSINFHLQKEKFNLKIMDKKVDILVRLATALDNTFVVDAYFEQPGDKTSYSRKIINQTAEGKELL